MTEEEQRYITDYLSGNLAPEERKRFSEWLAERPERQEAFREMGRTVLRARWSGRWAQTDAVKAFARVQKRLHARRLYRRMVQYAAVVLVAATAGIFLLRQEGTPTETPLVSTLPHPDNHRPVLTLHNGQSIVLSNEPQQVIAGTPAIDIRQTDSARLEYTPVSDTMDSEIHYNTLSVPKGCEFSLALADGTRIWVNAGSTLRYPERFAPGKREVFLSGEAYFEVTKNAEKPFVVHTGYLDIEVLGTSFNVYAYEREEVIEMALVSGRIKIMTNSEPSRTVFLCPNEKALFHKSSGNIQVRETDNRFETAWLRGDLVFHSTPLKEVIAKLERKYGVRIHLNAPSLANDMFTGNFDSEYIIEVMELLERHYGFTYEIQDKDIYITVDN